MGKIFYIIGKSAAGKDSLYEMLLQDPAIGLTKLTLYTTRPMREGETEGKEYHFVDEMKMERLKERTIECRTYDTIAGRWHYFTVDEEEYHDPSKIFLGIGTPESFRALREYYGKDHVNPIYVECEDGLRLERAIRREKKQEHPNYAEICRRYLADEADFAPERLNEAGITPKHRFQNESTPEALKTAVAAYILEASARKHVRS